MVNAILVSTTFETREDAEKMANLLLQERLVACAQISRPIASWYWWKDAIEHSTEYSLSMKSTEELFTALEIAIKEHHPYETPEIIGIPITRISIEYLDWMKLELKK